MDITVKNLQKKIPINPRAIIQAATKALAAVNVQIPLSIVFTGRARMRRINQTYLGHDYVTDVVTFKHGEIIICPSVAVSNARRYKTSVEKELKLYVVHGILHLAGYDDHAPKDIEQMRQKEQEIMRIVRG